MHDVMRYKATLYLLTCSLLVHTGECCSHDPPIHNVHCVQKKTPTHIFFHIFMNYLWI